ncbi:MAG: RHS repeat-associated core domain-containing protein [Chitinophagales bacterium]|nr:RHS repeat-associated core domain-containing protein [Chitinophagales bacterium]
MRDAQGNVMAVYEKVAWGIAEGQAKLTEHHVYGSSRLGIIKRDQDIDQPKETAVNIDLLGPTYLSNFKRGNKFFELSNHLGNVLVTVSDKHSGVDTSSDGQYDYYQADVVSASDYYPFGMQMVGRTLETSKYRYGFNGKEKDPEVMGEGNVYDYGFRIYNPRVGRFLSLDPLANKYSHFSPFHYAGNTPIQAIDQDGEEPVGYSLRSKIKPPGETWITIQGEEYIEQNVITGKVYRSIIRDAVGHEYMVFRAETYEVGLWNRLYPKSSYFYLNSNVNDPTVISYYTKDESGSVFHGNVISFEPQEFVDTRTGAAIADGIGKAVFVSGLIITGGILIDGAATLVSSQSVIDFAINEVKDEIRDQIIGVLSDATGVPLDLNPVSPKSFSKDFFKNLGKKTLKEKYDDLYDYTRKSYGGNVTIRRKGKDIFRIHNPKKPDSHGYKVTELERSTRTKGYATPKDRKVTKRHIRKIIKAINGEGGYDIRTLKNK